MMGLFVLLNFSTTEIDVCPNFTGKWSGRCESGNHGSLTLGPYSKFLEVRQQSCKTIELRWKTNLPGRYDSEEYEILKTYSMVNFSGSRNSFAGALAQWVGEDASRHVEITEQIMVTTTLIDPNDFSTKFVSKWVRLIDGKLQITEQIKNLAMSYDGQNWITKEYLSDEICSYDKGDFSIKSRPHSQ